MMVLHLRRPSTSKPLPPRPPPAKVGPGRPPPPNLRATGRSHPASGEASSPKPQAQKPLRKGPVLPPRPNPGHRLYNNYTVRKIPLHDLTLIMFQIPPDEQLFLTVAFFLQLQLSHGIAAVDYNGSNTGELSFQVSSILPCHDSAVLFTTSPSL